MQAVIIPIEHHSDPEVLEAKQKELANWTNFGVIMKWMIKGREQYQESGLFQKENYLMA